MLDFINELDQEDRDMANAYIDMVVNSVNDCEDIQQLNDMIDVCRWMTRVCKIRIKELKKDNLLMFTKRIGA